MKIDKSEIYVFWMNIGVEKIWNKNNSIIPKIKMNNEQEKIIKDTEQMCLLLKKNLDIVILRRNPPELIKKSLQQCGINFNNILIPKDVMNFENISDAILHDEELIEKLKKMNMVLKNKVKLVPYAVTSIEEEISRKTKCELIGPNAKLAQFINNKINNREIAQKLEFPLTEGRVCYNKEEINKIYKEIIKKYPTTKCVLKEAVGASGREMYVIKNKKDYRILEFFLQQRKDNEMKILFERWYNEAFSFNYQIYCNGKGSAEVIGITKQLVNNMVYMGSDTPVHFSSKVQKKINNYIEILKEYLIKIEYKGIASVDAIMVNNQDIYPLIEINGRMSLSSYPVIWKRNNNIKNICRFFYLNLQYSDKLEILEKYLMDNLFSIGGEGILPYVYSPASNKDIKGRIFLAIIGDSYMYIEKVQKNILEVIEKI